MDKKKTRHFGKKKKGDFFYSLYYGGSRKQQIIIFESASTPLRLEFDSLDKYCTRYILDTDTIHLERTFQMIFIFNPMTATPITIKNKVPKGEYAYVYMSILLLLLLLLLLLSSSSLSSFPFVQARDSKIQNLFSNCIDKLRLFFDLPSAASRSTFEERFGFFFSLGMVMEPV